MTSARAKRLRITVKQGGHVRVTIPKGMPHKFAEDFLLSKKQLVLKHIDKVKLYDYATLPEVENKIQASAFLQKRLAKLAKYFGYTYNKVTFRNQKTRWGSCSGDNNINLNYKIFLLPPKLQDYILLHELVHTEIKNHSKDFWHLLYSIFQNAKECRQELRNYTLR